MNKLCPICNRKILHYDESKHHLIPKCKKGTYTETVILHRICHNKIHATFSENELSTFYNTIERLIEHDDIKKFIKWIRKKPTEFYQKTKFSNERKFKR